MILKYDDNAVVVIDQEGNPKGTRVFGVIARELRLTEGIVKILLQEGFIENVRKHQENTKYFLVSTLGHRRNRKGQYRLFLNGSVDPVNESIPIMKKNSRILGGIGIVILSTSRGIMTDQEA